MKSLRNLIGTVFTAGLAFGLGAEALAQNVGIGTATPQARLDVAGDVRVQTLAPAATSPGIVVQGANNILQVMQGAGPNQTLVYNGTNWTVAPVPAGVVVTDGNIVIGDGTAANVIRLGNATNDGDALFWDPVAGQWVRRTLVTDQTIDGVGSAADPLRLAQQGAAVGEVLTWDGTNWVPGPAAGTVNTAGPVQGDGTAANPVTLLNGVAVGDVLIWDGAAWQIVNLATTPRLTGNGSAAAPFDIAQQGAATGEVLTWNGTNWAPAPALTTVNTLAPIVGDGSAANPVRIQDGTANEDILVWDAGTNSWVVQQFIGWKVDGNAGTNPTANFLGTTDNQGLSIRTNNLEAIRVTPTQQVGIGTAAPAAGRILHVNSTGGQLFNVTSTAPANGFIASDFSTQYSGLSLPANGDINGVRISTSTVGNAANERFGVRGLWSDALSDGIYTSAAYLKGNYRGTNTTVIPAAGDTIPVVLGVQGHSQLVSVATAANAAGVYGLSDSPQIGSNYGVVGAASFGQKFNFGLFGAANSSNRVLANVYNSLAATYGQLNAAVFAYNNNGTANDYAIFTEGATKSAFGGSVGVGVLNPTERIHTDGTARLEGMTVQPNGNFIVISDATGVLNTIQGTATGGEVLQYNGGRWEAVTLPGTSAIVTGNVVVGDGSASDPIRIADGSNPDETLVWDGTQWTIAANNDWKLGGNAIAGPVDYFGTSNNQGLSIRTNATEAMWISQTQLVGIGTNAPQRKLHVTGNSGIESEVTFNAPTNGFVANDFNTNLTGVTLASGNDVNGTKFSTSATGAAGGQWGVRSVWAEATGNAIYTVGIYTSGRYTGNNTSTVSLPGLVIPTVLGIQGQVSNSSNATASNAVGIYGLADSPQLGNNVGAVGLGFGGGNITMGMSAAANITQVGLNTKLNVLSTQTARFTAGLYAYNPDAGVNDFALYAEGPQSRVTGALEVGVAAPIDAHTTTLHVEGSFSGAVKTVSANYAATESDHIILANVTSNFTITLPSVTAQNNGMILHIKRIDNTGNVLQLSAFAGNNIETTGNTTTIIGGGLGSATLVANNGTWYIVATN